MPERGIRTIWLGGSPRLVADVCGVGTPIVFLHGLDGTRADWSAQLMAFARAGAALAYDARGHGDSEDPPEPLRVGDHVGDLGRVLDHVFAADGHVVGASTAAAVALAFALRRPERVRSLVLVSAGLGPGGDLLPGRSEAFVRARRDPLRADRSPAALGPELAVAQTGPAAEPSALARIAAGFARLHPGSYLQALAAFERHAESAALATLAVPTLVISGAADPYVAPAAALALAERLRARHVPLGSAGHLPHLERPSEFTAVLREFLSAPR